MNHKLLQQMYELYYNELYIYLCSLCRDASLAEDLIQETFMKAILSLPDEHTNVRAWLYLVARNLYFNHVAKLKRETPLSHWESMEPASEDNTLNHIISNERHRHLHLALQQLTDTKREILMLQYFGGFSQKEIASMMGLSPENVRVLGHRAKKDLARILKEQGHDI